MTTTADKYKNLITSEHRGQPKFEATIALFTQPFCDLQNLYASLPLLFDLDTGEGDQLDKIGAWIGLARTVYLPITGVYFSFDTPAAGFDLVPWWELGDPTFEAVTLDDVHYRLALKAKALNNAWDGSLPNAYAIWAALFAGTGYQISIQDYGDLTMGLSLLWQGAAPDDQTTALFEGGYLDVRPATVLLRGYTITQLALVLGAAAGAGSVTLSWPSIAGLTYEVNQGTAPGGEGPDPVATVTASGATTSVVIPGLTTGTAYYFKVKATNIYAQTVTSNEATATPT